MSSNKGGNISAPTKLGQNIQVKQASNSETPATLDLLEKEDKITHRQGDKIVWQRPQETVTFYPVEGSSTIISTYQVIAGTGYSREDIVGLMNAKLGSLSPLVYLGVGLVAIGILIFVFTPWKREGILLSLSGIIPILIHQLALSPWFTIIGGILIIGAGVTYYLEKKGYIKASGYGEANDEITRKRKEKTLEELKRKEEQIRIELEQKRNF